MSTTSWLPSTAFRYETEVLDNGRLELAVPLSAGARVVVFVIEDRESQDETLNDLVAAAQTSLAFWDNPYDDEDWNNA
jgi:hypothetical protein